MSFLFLGSGKIALDMWLLHHGGNIPCDHMVSPKEHKDMLHAPYRLEIASCYRNRSGAWGQETQPEAFLIVPGNMVVKDLRV
jgi:hypothetical protein